MSKKLITEGEVKERLSMDELIRELEDSFKTYYSGDTEMPPKSYIDLPEYNGDFRSMPARVKTDNINLAGVKWVNVHPDNEGLPTVMASLVINDPETGEPLAFIEGSELTSMRTGAVSGLATKYMTPSDITRLGLVGAGKQAYKQLEAVSCVRDIEEVYIHDIDDQAVQEFVNEFEGKYDIYSAKGTDEVMKSSDVICTITPVEDPIINVDNEKETHHINAIGADASGKQEINSNITSERKIVVDDIEQASHSGEVNVPIKEGYITKEMLSSLGELIHSSKDLRDTKTLFDSTGLAIQDITAAHLVNNH